MPEPTPAERALLDAAYEYMRAWIDHQNEATEETAGEYLAAANALRDALLALEVAR